jgi:hypothetical protein
MKSSKKSVVLLLGAFVICLGLVTNTQAVIIWNNDGNDGNWDTDAAWWGGNEPTATDGVRIDNSATVSVTLTGEVGNYLVLGYDPAQSGNLTMAGGNLTLSPNQFQVGRKGTGYVLQTGGTVNVDDLTAGSMSGGFGTYRIEGGTLSCSNDLNFQEGCFRLSGMPRPLVPSTISNTPPRRSS